MVTPIDHFPLILKLAELITPNGRCQEATDYTLKYGDKGRQKSVYRY
jgi:hypothetical protein